MPTNPALQSLGPGPLHRTWDSHVLAISCICLELNTLLPRNMQFRRFLLRIMYNFIGLGVEVHQRVTPLDFPSGEARDQVGLCWNSWSLGYVLAMSLGHPSGCFSLDSSIEVAIEFYLVDVFKRSRKGQILDDNPAKAWALVLFIGAMAVFSSTETEVGCWGG